MMVLIHLKKETDLSVNKIMLTRKKFLSITGLGMGALATHKVLGNNVVNMLNPAEDCNLKKNMGIQLWTVRDAMAKDPKGTLAQLASYGYKQVESFDSETGIFWGMTNKAFKAYLKSLGMTINAAHFMDDKRFEATAASASEIGMKYLIFPWEGSGKTLDDYKRFAEDFNKKGAICKKYGMRFAFHNHDFSFNKMEGQFPQDILMQNTDADLVDFEMDLYWVVTTGQDPIAWFNKYPNRFRLCHIKDRMKNAQGNDASCVLGTGIIDFASILKVAKKQGMKYYLVEQEKFTEGSSMECAKMNADYIKKLKL
jgi:sugar phosphate isomerase/epimerase